MQSMHLKKRFALLLAATCVAISPVQAAGIGTVPAEERGPHGGILLEQDDTIVELQIFERGVPPEYRAWVTRNDAAVTDGIDLDVRLTRLGGQVDAFDFTHQGEYWLGDRVVAEPHSFDVTVTLAMDGREYRWDWQSHEGRTRIAPEIAQRSGITTATAGPGVIERSVTAYGRLTLAPEQRARVHARFPGVVTQVNASLGDQVERGDVLARVESDDSLQTYALHAPLAGVVTARATSAGETTGPEPLFVIADLSTLWAELKIFPGQRDAVVVGQHVRLKAGDVTRTGVIRHLLPAPGDEPYSVARIEVDNSSRAWTPGLLVTGEIVVETREVPLAVDNRALQSFRDWTVVFVQVGDTYEIRPLQPGRSDDARTEVRDGLRAGDRYVVGNSYLIKADIEKSGASHDH